jgi:predicted RNA-binding protein with TRAM domain
MYRLLLLWCIPAALLSGQSKKADAKASPRVLMTIPFGVEPGKTTVLTLRGLRLDVAKEVKVSSKGAAKLIKAEKVAVPNQQDAGRVGDSEVRIELELPADVAGDAVELVVVTPAGDTASHKLLLDRAPVAKEKEPNDGFKQGQALEVGRSVEGVISRSQDVDVFRFEAKPGDKVVVEVTAARRGSALDSFLTLYNADGQVVAMNDDAGGSRDSRLEATLKKGGAYYVSVTDANDQGGAAFRYRLLVR